MLTDEILGLGATEHLHRYAIAVTLAKNKVVLDIASGEGYGTALLSQYATKVYGVDISQEAVEFAKKKYKKENLTFLHGSANQIPLPENSIDYIVSFETIEHHDKHEEMMAEFKRVLKPGGLVIISTPAKEIYQHLHIDNPYHVKEITSEDFLALISRYFPFYRILRQRYIEASFVYPMQNEITSIDEFTGDFTAVEKNDFLDKYYYNIAICSAEEEAVPKFSASFFDGININLIRNERKLQEAKQRVEKHYLNSTSYKVGHIIMSPVISIKKLFKK